MDDGSAVDRGTDHNPAAVACRWWRRRQIQFDAGQGWKIRNRSFGEPQSSDLEPYYWMVWTTLASHPTKRILLSNDNLMSENPSDGVVRLVRFSLN